MARSAFVSFLLESEGNRPGAEDQAVRLQRIFTTWHTVLYVDVISGDLRHGIVDDRPVNAIFVPEGSGGRIMYFPGQVGPLRPVACLTDHSRVLDENSAPETATLFEIVALPQSLVGFKAGNVYLCAEPDGRITLSKTVCSLWETFRVSDDQSGTEPISPVTRQTGTVVETVVDGCEIRFFVANAADEIQKCHYDGRFQEAKELEIIKKYSCSGRVFVDVGSNVGNHAIFVSKFLDYAKILVFEPNPAAISILRVNLLLNRCGNVDLRYLGFALGAVPQRARIIQRYANHLGGAALEEDQSGDIITLPGDELLLSQEVGFIKIDVEGMEIEILTGLSQTIQRWRPKIMIEVWSANDAKFFDWCRQFGYAIRVQVPHYWMQLNYTNYLIVPQ